MNSARGLAWQVLLNLAKGKETAEVLLRRELADARLSTVDRALVWELVAGTIRWRSFLDYAIAAYLTQPLEKLDMAVLDLLRLGAYQLLRLDRVPAYAALNSTVELAKQHPQTSRAAGLVNAVLRKISKEYPPLPSAEEDPVEHLAIRLSHPRWLVERWLARFGFEETARLLEFNNQPAETFFFLNTAKVKDLAGLGETTFTASAVEGFADCYRITSGRNLPATAAYQQGLLSPGNPATLLATLLLAPAAGEEVLDACAAPGGKLFHLRRLGGTAVNLTALELRKRRVKTLRDTDERLALGATIQQGDILDPPFAEESFNKLLLDVPCTNTGVLRRRVEARWWRSPADLVKLPQIQAKLLRAAAKLLKPKGLLAYSTCSLEPEENEGVVEGFLAEGRDFRLVQPAELLPAELRDFVDDVGYLRSLPQRSGHDGAFVALLERIG